MFRTFEVNKKVVVFDGKKFLECVLVEVNANMGIEGVWNGVQITIGGRILGHEFTKQTNEPIDPDSIHLLLVDTTRASAYDQVIGYASRTESCEDRIPETLAFFL